MDGRPARDRALVHRPFVGYEPDEDGLIYDVLGDEESGAVEAGMAENAGAPVFDLEAVAGGDSEPEATSEASAPGAEAKAEVSSARDPVWKIVAVGGVLAVIVCAVFIVIANTTKPREPAEPVGAADELPGKQKPARSSPNRKTPKEPSPRDTLREQARERTLDLLKQGISLYSNGRFDDAIKVLRKVDVQYLAASEERTLRDFSAASSEQVREMAEAQGLLAQWYSSVKGGDAGQARKDLPRVLSSHDLSSAEKLNARRYWTETLLKWGIALSSRDDVETAQAFLAELEPLLLAREERASWGAAVARVNGVLQNRKRALDDFGKGRAMVASRRLEEARHSLKIALASHGLPSAQRGEATRMLSLIDLVALRASVVDIRTVRMDGTREVTLDKGIAQGLKDGMRMVLYRNGQWVGNLTVRKASSDSAPALVTWKNKINNMDVEPKRGDYACVACLMGSDSTGTQVSIGKDQGVKPGMKFLVFRGKEKMGELQAKYVDDLATLTGPPGTVRVEVGDVVWLAN